MEKADEKALYFSPSRMALGLKDAVFHANGEQSASQKTLEFEALNKQRANASHLTSGGPLRAAHRLMGAGLSGLTSPSGT